MPSLIEIPLEVIRPPTQPITARQLHGALSHALGDHPGSDLSAWPLLVQDDDARRMVLRLGWKPGGSPPMSLLEPDRLWRLGSLRARAGFPQASEVYFEEMIATPPVDEIVLHVRSPALFRTTGYGDFKRRVPLPDPRRIFQRLLEEWNRYASGLQVEPADIADFVSCLELVDWEPAMGTAVLDRGPGGGEVEVRGFLGPVRIRVQGPRPTGAERLLTAAAMFAPLCGIGSWTNRGLGAVTAELSSAVDTV